VVFKTTAIDHSATSPHDRSSPGELLRLSVILRQMRRNHGAFSNRRMAVELALSRFDFESLVSRTPDTPQNQTVCEIPSKGADLSAVRF
jgi:hypothetical protein